MGRGGTGAKEVPPPIDPEDSVPLVGGCPSKSGASDDPNVEHEAVDLTEGSNRLGDGGFGSIGRRHVSLDDDSLTALGADLRGRVLGRGVINIDARHLGALSGR